MAKITKQWLQKKKACQEAVDWVVNQSDKDEFALFKKCLAEKRFEWASWCMVRRLSLPDKRRYAIYAANQVLYLFADEYPNDKRPRRALAAARKYLKAPTKKNANTAYAAGGDSRAAGDVAFSTAAVHAAYAAAHTGHAVYAAAHAVHAVDYADAAIVHAVHADADAVRIKILKYGVKLYKARKIK